MVQLLYRVPPVCAFWGYRVRFVFVLFTVIFAAASYVFATSLVV
jgi:hypothetical protein